MHLKSVQKTMMVSNMQKWMPAFRRLEAKFASTNMTDAEKQDALKVVTILFCVYCFVVQSHATDACEAE